RYNSSTPGTVSTEPVARTTAFRRQFGGPTTRGPRRAFCARWGGSGRPALEITRTCHEAPAADDQARARDTMTAFFTRLTFAFRTFFAILFRDRIPDDVAAALGAVRPSAQQSQPGPPAVVNTEATATQMLAVLQRDGR